MWWYILLKWINKWILEKIHQILASKIRCTSSEWKQKPVYSIKNHQNHENHLKIINETFIESVKKCRFLLFLSVNRFHLFIMTICIQQSSNRYKIRKRREQSKWLNIIRFRLKHCQRFLLVVLSPYTCRFCWVYWFGLRWIHLQ